MTRRRAALAALLATTIAAAAPPPASAGEYPVWACEPGLGDRNNAWIASVDRAGMTAYASCLPPATETRVWNKGLVTRHVMTPATVGLFNHAAMTLRAPAGASLARIKYSHDFCGLNGFQVGLANAADQWLDYAGPGWCGTPSPNPNTLNLHGTTAVKLYTMCAQLSCSMTSTLRAWATLRSATVTVSDYTSPSVSLAGGTLASGTWMSGTQTAVVAASDNVGIKQVEVWIGDRQVAVRDGSCDFTQVVPCTVPSGTLPIDTPVVKDGVHRVVVRAIDSAGKRRDRGGDRAHRQHRPRLPP